MVTTINIGTDKKNITGVKIQKPFKDITFKDIQAIVIERLGLIEGNNIQGWCDVTKYPNQ